MKGVIKLNDILCLGPDSLGHFIPVAIKSIHRKRMPVREVKSGQTASFALKKIRRADIRKGMVMVSPVVNPQAYWEFEGEILVLHHPTTISARYQAMVHCGSVRQTASILSMTRDCLRTGDKATVHFRFMKNPEYLRVGQKMVFREGRTKAIGNISKVWPGTPPNHGNKNNVKKMVRPNDSVATANEGGTIEGSGSGRRRGGGRYKAYSTRSKPYSNVSSNIVSTNVGTTSVTNTIISSPAMFPNS